MVLHTLQQSNAQITTPHKHPTFAEEAQQDLQSSYAERSKPILKEADVLKARHNYLDASPCAGRCAVLSRAGGAVAAVSADLSGRLAG